MVIFYSYGCFPTKPRATEVWGKSSSDPGEGIMEFRNAMGVLNGAFVATEKWWFYGGDWWIFPPVIIHVWLEKGPLIISIISDVI